MIVMCICFYEGVPPTTPDFSKRRIFVPGNGQLKESNMSSSSNFMASSYSSCCFFNCCFSASLPNPSSATRCSLSFSHSIVKVHNGNSLKGAGSSSRISAKFEKSEGEPPLDSPNAITPSTLPAQLEINQEEVEEEEDDSFLIFPQVELLIPQLQFLDEEGAQAELWELSRIFLDTLIEETGSQRIKAIFPDAGAAALLKYKWKDAAFGFSSLSDRKPVETEDEIVVMVVPDYQMLEYVQKIASDLSDDPPRSLIMWNPRLISEDVGVGVNVRQLKRTFTTVYSMRPMPSGAVFRCYPGLWKVFSDDKDRPNRYLLAKELVSRPDAEDLEIIFGNVEENSEQGPSLFTQAAGIFSSLNRFMKAISK
ncbi:hypothetical protein CJ030_MR8G010097 [Morella rubra]|uniref:DUF1995 domain-containing protein n=1 Tax=Morella rubra TaxID=262757 RepID=A0A6A1UPV0_9ROSI|nr:hypothetical protein CJ030_MR8G010097 [Morella rubra]